MTATRERTHRGGTEAAISMKTLFAMLCAFCSWGGSLHAADGANQGPTIDALLARALPFRGRRIRSE